MNCMDMMCSLCDVFIAADLLTLERSCFIATAAFGSELYYRVDTLGTFRDEYLMNNSVGKAFVSAYYRYSPPAADYIAERGWLRAVVRIMLLPVVGLVSLFV